ncbi:14965_t:CDS:2 [Funneliformis geosporum]|nr:14965_t:CDS:2 [Funneliformis geosporum]
MDDKHRCKAGESGYPVAAIESGKQVKVLSDKFFVVSDHDFTKCEIIPSVMMFYNILVSIKQNPFLLIYIDDGPDHLQV